MIITEKLSKSIICEWNIVRKEPPNNYNILSVVYFQSEKISNKTNKYYEGLRNIIKYMPTVLPEFKLRIYYDNSSEHQVNMLVGKNNDNIELFKYDIPKFKNENGYHKGKIGTMLRFLPLYDNNIHRADKVIIFDIDNILHNWYKILVTYFDKNKIKLAYRTRGCYGIRQRIICTEMKYYSIIASFIYQSINLPYSIFSDFLEDTFIIKSLNNLIVNCGLKSEYSYGIDEIYINKYHLMYFYKNKIDICSILFNHLDISNGLKDYIHLLSNKNELNVYVNFLNKLFKILNMNYDLNKFENNKTEDIILLKTELEELLNDNKYWEANRQYLYNILNTSVPKEIYKLLLDTLKSQKNILPEIKLLIKCLLINFQLDLKKINIYLIKTDYKNKPIIKSAMMNKIKY